MLAGVGFPELLPMKDCGSHWFAVCVDMKMLDEMYMELQTQKEQKLIRIHTPFYAGVGRRFDRYTRASQVLRRPPKSKTVVVPNFLDGKYDTVVK